jgi:hypothetical protein
MLNRKRGVIVLPYINPAIATAQEYHKHHEVQASTFNLAAFAFYPVSVPLAQSYFFHVISFVSPNVSESPSGVKRIYQPLSASQD